MAGGKETPRQKLVGMMYLVLLALLAMNVSGDILNKFVQLNKSLETFVKEGSAKNEVLLSSIETKVGERGNKENEVDALEKAKKLNKLSKEIKSQIDEVKTEIVEATGGIVDGKYQGKKNMDDPARILIGVGEKKNGKGYDLQKDLSSYITELNKIYVEVQKATGDKNLNTEKYASMTLDPKVDPQYQIKGRLDDHVKGKDWVQANFDHSPMVAVLAALTDIQSKVVVYEGEILSKLKTVVGAADFKFDKLDVMANADASTVAAGTEYKARIFLTAFSDKMQPQITARGNKLKVIGGMGELKFKASLPKTKPNKDGLYESSYNAIIEVPDPLTGELKPYTKKVKYFVSKPVIQVKAGDVAALYKDCGNPLNIQVPALGALYAPKFSVSGGTYRDGGKGKGSIVVIPTKATVGITVSSGGQRIGVEKFKVRLVPKPTIVATSRGKEINPKGVLAPGPRKIKMKAEAEAGFKAALPKDAKFRVTKWTATLVRGKRPVVSPKTFSKPDGNLTAFASKAKNGDRIMIEVKKVFRKTYTGKNVEVKIPTTIINIPLTD